MIYKNGKLILTAKQWLDLAGVQVEQKIGAIYKGAQLVWLTVYDAIKSCFGSGTWLGDKNWILDDIWKSN